jgi:hypothetical protein
MNDFTFRAAASLSLSSHTIEICRGHAAEAKCGVSTRCAAGQRSSGRGQAAERERAQREGAAGGAAADHVADDHARRGQHADFDPEMPDCRAARRPRVQTALRVSQTGRARQAGLWAAWRGGGRGVGGRRAPRGAATAPEAEAEQCAAAPAGRTVARGAACAPLMSVESPMISGGSALAAMRSLAFRGGLPAGIVRGGPARRSPKPARSARAVRAGAGPCALTTLCGRAARRLERYLEYLKQPAGLGAVSPCHSGLALRSPPRPSPPSAPGTQPPTRQKSRAVAFGCAPTRRSLLRGLPCSSPSSRSSPTKYRIVLSSL